MFKKILVATDGSDSSKEAFRVAIKIAQQMGSQVFLLNATFVPYAYWGAHTVAGNIINQDELHSMGEEMIAATMNYCDIGDVPVTPVIVKGTAAVEIVKYATQENIRLIVMGSHGHGPISGAFLGSVSQRVLQKAPCPVMVVKDQAAIDKVDVRS